ncbi:ribosomal protein S6 kinase [Aureococcus anophagefferens]|nr:ribosomal protein S6 kinase [Aureococcus anophagefferens]
MSFPSIAAALTEDDGNGSDFSDADHHDEGLPMEVSLRLQAKDSLAAPESPRSKTTEAAEAKLAVAKAKLDAARLERSRFGTVLLVKKRTGFTRGKLYAMKVMAKADTSAKMAKVERDVLVRLCHVRSPFLVSICYAFQSRTKVYMVMQFIDGSCLEAQQTALLDCDDPKAAIQFVAAELTLGLVHLHLAGIIHHDIKPANCLVRHDGHLFICDFGLATLTEGKRDCGFKPAKLQDKACVAVKRASRAPPPTTSPRVDAAARTFLGRLLSKDVKARHGVDSVQSDPYFHAVSWPRLKKRLVPPPFQPPCDCVDEADFCDRFESDALMRRWYDDAPPSPRSDQRNYELMAFEFTHASHKSLSLSDGLDDPNRGESDETTLDAIDTFGRLTSPSQKDPVELVGLRRRALVRLPLRPPRRRRGAARVVEPLRAAGLRVGAAAGARRAPPRSAESAP